MQDVVWGVMWMMAVLLTGTGWVIYYIMRLAYIETREGETTVSYPIIGTVTSESRTTEVERERVDPTNEGVEIGARAYAR